MDIRFFSEYLKYPKEVGSIIPSSRYLTDKVLDPINWKTSRKIVELGPGTGIMTRGILRNLTLDGSQLHVFEINAEYARALNEIGDVRLQVHVESAWNIEIFFAPQSIDAVVSCIPLSNFTHDETISLLSAIKNILVPGGVYTQIQYLPRRRKDILEVFPEIHTAWEIRNIPPSFVYSAYAN